MGYLKTSVIAVIMPMLSTITNLQMHDSVWYKSCSKIVQCGARVHSVTQDIDMTRHWLYITISYGHRDEMCVNEILDKSK